ncbi:hypothetical protein sos41_02610 [Alphaproteobacteria bacterium SO-S41]|nr:hypothetical protein sos41_02610 [Alphaproteobacteria bacterium SO-S41]
MTPARKDTAFIPAQRLAQGAFLTQAEPDCAGYRGSAYRLAPDAFARNFAPELREMARAYFEGLYGIAWHQHVAHGLSSQAACINFLMPLATRPDWLSRLVGYALEIAPPIMLPVEPGPGGTPWYVGFEWIGKADYLNEWPAGKPATRGANATSTDAIVRFEHDGRIETLLIEWKYSESYGAPVDAKGTEKRRARYQHLAFAPRGPLRADLGLTLDDFFWEPFYQMLRQMMLARRMEDAHEADTARVRVLHLSPAGNRDLHKVTAPRLRETGGVGHLDAYTAFQACLAPPADGVARFIPRTIEAVFAPLLQQAAGERWARYLIDRYSFATQPG